MSAQPVIPTPHAQRWLDFRVQWLPLLVFAAALVAAAYVWQQFVFPASLVGRVEGPRADVSPPRGGVVTKLFVTRFQTVNAGDPIAEIAPVDLKVLEASLGVIRADIDLLRSGVGPAIAGQRAAISYDRLKLDWLRQRITMAITRTQLLLAEIELGRAERLWKDKLVSDADYDTAKTRRDTLTVSLEEHGRLSADVEQSLHALLPASETVGDPTRQLAAAIAVAEQKLRLTEAEMSPRLLTAPIEGSVSVISKWCGETAAAAEPIVTIGATKSERVIGYLRQPFYLNPTTNMTVQIRTRGCHRKQGVGRILAVGDHLLPINDVLLPPTKYNVAETGLPIVVSLPPEIKKWVRPGELVDLTIAAKPPGS